MSYAISGGHQKTIEAAEIILKKGGNAVDASIAAYLVSFIAEPCMASIGAGGFAMINDNKAVKMVDFFCETPKVKKSKADQEFYPVVVDFGNTKEEFYVGKGSIAVPGAIAGIYKMHEIWGKIPMAELIEPALLWAKEGIKLDKFQAYDFTLLKDIFHLNKHGRALFFDKEDNLKVEGDIIRMSKFADFLEVLKHEGKDFFYKGDIAKQIDKDLRDGGHLTRHDFENYKVNVLDPISFKFGNKNIYTPGFPSVGGMLLAALLNTFQDLVVNEHHSFLSISHFQRILDAFSQIQNLKNNPQNISNYLFNQFGIKAVVEQHYKGRKWGGTSHFNVIDSDGMTVCLTTSIGEGSGYFIEGTDMQMNNMLGEEALMPNGFYNWDCDVRLQSMMSPSIVLDSQGKTLLGIGSGGAGRIPYALAQTIINLFYFGIDPDKAVSAPRIHLLDGKIEMERGFDIAEDFLQHVNVWDEKSLFFGGTNIIFKENQNMMGIADERRYGGVINNN